MERADMEEQTDYYQQQLLSLISKSKQEFITEYNMYDDAKGRGIYLQVLNELLKATSEGNVNSFKKLSNLIEYIGNVKSQVTLKDYYNNFSNPIRNTNIVILACKHNTVEVLKFIFSNKMFLDNLTINVGNNAIAPNDKDETCHNAFYYAIRWGNVKLLDTLINKWPDNYFAARSEELDLVLSKAYEELKLKNVPLLEIIEIFVENKLINLRFFSNNSGKVQSTKYYIDNIRERINIVLENIDFLVKEYLNEKKIDQTFLFIAKYIAQNINALKRQLKSTYDRIPWEEIEFCLVSFISSHVKRQEINLFYRSTLTKNRMLNHLENFANKLEDEKYTIEDVDIDKISNLPCLRREQVVAEIVNNYPQFSELYMDHQQIRDNHSLEKINNYIKLALSADPKEREGQLIITRALQVIGEYLKNTLESPKLSNTTSELLLLSLPKNTRKIIVELRNSLSHAYSLSRRIEIEENQDVKFFLGVQNDANKIGVVINDILYKHKIKMIRILLEKIVNCNNSDEMMDVVSVLSNSNVEFDKMISENFKMIEHTKLEELIKELSDNITDKTNYEMQMFSKINQIINSAAKRSADVHTDYITGFAFLKVLGVGLNDNNIDHNVIRGRKFIAKQTLQNMTPKIEPRTLKEIAKCAWAILYSAERRIQSDKMDKINELVCNIFYITEFETGEMKYIEDLRGKLNEKGSFIPSYKQTKDSNSKAVNSKIQIAKKLSQLKDILSNKLLISKPNDETLSLYRNDQKLQAVVEMLVLDIMSILGHSNNNYLDNNLLFLDDILPLLNGKSLRNHLAHDNALVDILLSDSTLSVILNAKKLIEGDIMKSKKRIGKVINDDPFKLKEKYNKGLAYITIQDRMFTALEEGNLESFKDCLQKGADINARNINAWTTLHFAAKGPSLEVIKFILDKNVSPNVKDINGQSPLHVAAACGRGDIVKFLIKEAGSFVDVVDNLGKTPLHFAAQNGHKDTVEVLLQNKANNTTHDLSGVSPLAHAIRNNQIEVAKVLLAKDANVDINETMGGYTPLHEAAEFGYLELVHFLLKNKADVNARNDKNWTPLHAASLNGHLDVVNTLILEGADAKATVIDGCTPLHYATENGHEDLVSVLLKNGADVNAADKAYNNTVLHYAAKYGYLGIVNILLKNKANASIETVGGLTPLHLAVHGKHLEIVEALLKHGVNIQSKDKSNATPLHYAVKTDCKEIVELLIKNGAEVNAGRCDHETPLHIAALEGNKDIVDLLLKNRAKVDAHDVKDDTPLHRAASRGSIDVIDLLIKKNAKVNERGNGGLMPLHFAAKHGRLAAIDFLIKNKADVNARADYGFTPLHTAVLGGHKDVITLLIKNKAQIDAGIMTPLLPAVESGHKEIVQILIENGADINVKSSPTPLLSAIKNNHKEIVEILIENGANINSTDSDLLTLAVLAGYREIVHILLKNNVDVNIKGPENVTALHIAAKRGDKNIVNALLNSRADVDAIDNHNATPLYFAAHEGHEEVVELLIENGATINVITVEGTPLHIAAGSGHHGVVKVLLNNGATTNIKDNENRTALELAVAHGHLEIVKMLIRHKKEDMNLKGKCDWTILHIASQESNLEMVKYLVEEGSDINAKNISGSKPVHIAAREGHKDTVDFFLTIGININDTGVADQTLLHYAALKCQLEVLKYLISKGGDVNAQDANGISPLHLAANYGNKAVVMVLLKNGAVYNATDKRNRKPLEMSQDKNVIILFASTEKLFKAVKHNNSSEVKSCIEAGAFVNAKNIDGVKPLHYAAWKGYDAIVNVLLQNKADPNATNNDGSTPLHYAAKFSNLKVVMALLYHGAVYNAVSDNGKMPLDLAADKGIIDLFQLVNESFKNIKNGSSKVINALNKINELDTIKAIMGARNRDGETLVVAAVHSNFSNLEQLKNISQGDVSAQIKIALMHSSQGNHQKALNIFKLAFEKRKQILGPANPGTLDIQTHIASVLYVQGFYEEALNTYNDILQKQTQELGLNNKDTLSTRGLIALVLHRQGKDDEAFNIYQEVYQIQTEILGSNHSNTLDTLFHMALVLERQGKYEEALNANRRVYQKRRETSGANHPLTVRAQNNIAMVLASQGKYEEALQMYKKVFEKKKLVFGINHSDTLRTLHNIAGVLLSQKKYPEALQTHQEVFNIQKNVLGPNHPDTLKTQYNMANTIFAQGKWVRALKAYRECIYQIKAVFGPSHPSVLDISLKLEMIKQIFTLQGSNECEVLLYLQKEINNAASIGDSHTVQRLIKDGVDVNDKDIEGRTALHFAVSSRRINIVNILLKAGADVTQITNKGNTALHTAASKGYKEMVDVLLQHIHRDKLNDFVNAKTTAGGTTALHVAVKGGYLEIVKCLLNHGAIYDMKNKESQIPLDICKDQSIAGLLKLIQELFKYANNGRIEIVSKLKAVKRDEFFTVTSARNNQGNTLLQVVIINKHKNIASMLLEVLKTRKLEHKV